jgi:hypothetical protein
VWHPEHNRYYFPLPSLAVSDNAAWAVSALAIWWQPVKEEEAAN